MPLELMSSNVLSVEMSLASEGGTCSRGFRDLLPRSAPDGTFESRSRLVLHAEKGRSLRILKHSKDSVA